MDSTEIKAEGEGALSAASCGCACLVKSGTPANTHLTHVNMCCRAKGGPKRRIWRKIHIGIDEKTLEVRAVEVTTNNIGDAPMLPELLNQIPPDQDIGSVTAPSHACKHALPGNGRGV